MRKKSSTRLLLLGLCLSFAIFIFTLTMRSNGLGVLPGLDALFSGASQPEAYLPEPVTSDPRVQGYISINKLDRGWRDYEMSIAERAIGGSMNAQGVPVSIAAASCSETDGGLDENVAGSMAYSNYSQTLSDYCLPNGTSLLEYYCPYGQQNEIVCQRGCSSGACVNDMTLACVDNDGGFVWSKKSTIQLYQNNAVTETKEDTCVLSGGTSGGFTPMSSCIGDGCILLEYGCTEHGNERDLKRNCLTNGCKDGVCLDAPSSETITNVQKTQTQSNSEPVSQPPQQQAPSTPPPSLPPAQQIDPSGTVVSQRYKSIVKIKTYVINPYGFLTQLSSGSGVIIDPRGIVLTNEHVAHVTDGLGKFMPAAYLICVSTNIDTAPQCNYRANFIRYDKNLDLALLRMEPISGLSMPTSFDFIPMQTEDTTVIGDELYAIGYPAIGDSSITATKGTVSGKLKKYDVNWIKTDAIISYGSSGGAALDKNGALIGLTTAGRSDLLGTLGYIVHSASMQPWISQYLNTEPRRETIDDRMSRLAQTMRSTETMSQIKSPDLPFSIDKPVGWDISFDGEHVVTIENGGSDSGGRVKLVYYKTPYPYGQNSIIPELKSDLMATGAFLFSTIGDVKDITVNGVRGKKITLSASMFGQSYVIHKYLFVAGNYFFNITAEYGDGDQDSAAIESMIQSLKITGSTKPLTEITSYSNADPKFSISTPKDWIITKRNDVTNPIVIESKKYPDARVNINVHATDSTLASKGNQGLLDYYAGNIQSMNQSLDAVGFKIDITKKNANYPLNGKLRKVVLLESTLKKKATNEVIAKSIDYLIPLGSKHLEVELLTISKDAKILSQVKQSFNSMLRQLAVQ